MPSRLLGKIALITGASSGLGAAIAAAYADEGAHLCCVDLYPSPRNPVNVQTGKADSLHNRRPNQQATHEYVQRTYGVNAIFVQADVTCAADLEAAIQHCARHFGRLDIMVNNAGISVESTHLRPMRIHETSEADYDTTMAVNAKGIFLGCKYAIQQMLEQDALPPSFAVDDGDDSSTPPSRGWIINIASVQGLVPYYGTPSYCASKGAAVMLTKQVALDYAGEGIHCNALCPGFLQTAMTQNLSSQPGLLKEISAKHPFGGMGQVEDVARMAVVLASEDARWMTGVALPVDGGYLLH
jgi:NAD(P)-dependent dehydrogenase (short-subunit alcohol dehydrogenase family)